MEVLLKVLLFSCSISYINGKKTLLPDYNKKSGNLNECQRCKILTDSFNYWLDKTSRGKFEGGDTAWEEAKLKSYSRSEVRLVEVQESLCSELKKHQDYCYTLAEETEMVFEEWWLMEHSNSVDLYTWVCIHTLQYCCPKNHFGVSCSLCPVDKNNEVCGGVGYCDGDGTRKGNGTCLCKEGYKGKLCEKCAKSFFSSNSRCKPCHKVCSECTDYGVNACLACTAGWQMESGVCKDIDECLDSLICKDNEYCINSEGSFNCKLCDQSCKNCVGEGPSNCTSCEPSSILWNGICVDDSLKSNILRSTFKRMGLYLGLIAIILLILRHSRKLASIIVVFVAMYIYFSEQMSFINILNGFAILYFN